MQFNAKKEPMIYGCKKRKRSALKLEGWFYILCLYAYFGT